jgi:membrane protein YdbS with pleckstrin-like domain
MFENAEILAEELPSVDTVDWQPLDDKFIRRQLTQSAITILIVIVGIGILQTIFAFALADRDISFVWLWLLPLLLAIPLFAWPLVSVPRRAYSVRSHDILFKSGVFWRTVTAIPFNRVQHVEKSSTPLDRKFKLATLQLFTAGGSGGDLKIDGLPAKTAEKLRAYILDKIGTGVEQG